MKKVTVIMPAYNHEKFIAESIESILCQTYKNIDIIILNDGSVDNTKDIIEKYVKLNSNIKFIDKPNNEGTVAGLNDLLDEVTSEYVIWLSSDDIMYPHTVQKLMDCVKNNPNCNIIFGGVMDVDEFGNEVKYEIHAPNSDKYFFHKMLLIKNMIPGCSVVTKVECYKNAGKFDARFRYAHDYHMWLKIFANNDAAYVYEHIYKNRVHDEQFTALGRNEVDAVRVFFDIIKNENIIEKYLNKIGIVYNNDSIVCLIKQYSNHLIGFRSSNEKNEFIYQLNKYINHSNLSTSHKNELLKEKKFFEYIVDSSFVNNIKITKEIIDNGFVKFAEIHSLDGMIINKEAVRYNLIENDAECLYKKVIPHDNFLCVVKIKHKDLEKLESELLYFYFSKCNRLKDYYNIGVTSYMALNSHFKDKFEDLDMKISVTINSSIYRIIIEEGLCNE